MNAVSVNLSYEIPPNHIIWLYPDMLDGSNPSLGRTPSSQPVSVNAKIVVSSSLIVTRVSGSNLIHEIPKGTLIIIRVDSNTKIAETAQPLQVTGPVYPIELAAQ